MGFRLYLPVCLFWLSVFTAWALESEHSSNAEWLGDHDANDLTVIENKKNNPLPKEKNIGSVRDLRLGFVNFRRIMASVPQLNDLRTRLDREFGAEEKNLIQAQKDLATMEQKLAVMERGDAYFNYEKQVIAKRRDVARRDASFRDSFSVRRNEELAKLQKMIADEIIALAKAEGYDVILNDTGVFYVSERADLSAVVIERLKRKAKTEED